MVSIARVMPFCNFNWKMFSIVTDSAYFVKSTPPRAFSVSF